MRRAPLSRDYGRVLQGLCAATGLDRLIVEELLWTLHDEGDIRIVPDQMQPSCARVEPGPRAAGRPAVPFDLTAIGRGGHGALRD